MDWDGDVFFLDLELSRLMSSCHPVICLADHAKSRLGQFAALLRLLQLLLSLAVLGQVEGGDLLGLLDLLLVGLDLLLQLAGQLGHPVLALLVLVLLERQLLHPPLGLLVALQPVAGAGLDVAELDLQLADARLQLGHGVAASADGGVASLGQAGLHLAQLGLEGALGLGLLVGVLLLGAQLVGEPGGVNHGLLGLLLAVLGLVQHVVDLGVHRVDLGLESALLGAGLGVDAVHGGAGQAGLGQLGLGLLLAAVGGVQEGAGLLYLALQGVGTSLGERSLLGDLLANTGGILEGALGLADLSLIPLDRLQSLRVCLVGVVQGNLQLVNLSLQLLLDAQGLGLGLLLALQRSLHRLHGALVILACVVELFLLLGNLLVNLLAHLSQLQLSPQHLVLFLLQSSLGLLQGSLQLLLLDLEPPALFVQLVDGAASVAELIQKILDLISEVLVLATDHVQLFVGLVQRGLDAERLGVVVAALGVAGLQFGSQVLALSLPLADNLVEAAASLLGDDGSSVGPLVLHLKLLQVHFHPVLGLLGGSDLLVQGVDGLLSLGDAGAQLVLGALQLVDATKTLGLKLGLPQLDLGLGLGESTKDIVLLLRLLLDPLAQILRLGVEVLELGEQGGAVTGLGIPQPLGVLQLGAQGDFVLGEGADGVLGLLDLAAEVLALDLQLLLGGVGLVEGARHLVQLLVGLDNQALGHLAVLLDGRTVAHGLVEPRARLLEVALHAGLVLLGLGLVLVEAVDGLAHVGHGVVVLGAEGGKGSLVGDVGLVQLGLELGQLSLALLVELDLGRGVGADLLDATAEVLDVAGEDGAVLLGLGPVATLDVELLIELLQSSLQLLDLLGVLAAERLLVLGLGGEAGELLLLPLDGLADLALDALQVGHGLLGQLEVALNLALHLLGIALGLLLTLESILALIERLLELALDLAEMVATILHGLDVLLSLLATLADGLLFLAELGNQILLVGDLLAESADLVVLGHLVLLALLDGALEVLDLVTKHVGLGGDLGAGLVDTSNGLLLALDAHLGLINLFLQIILCSLDAVGFVDDVLDHGAARVKSQLQLLFLSLEPLVDLLDGVAIGNSLVNVGLGGGNLVLVLLLELAELGALEVGLDGHPDLGPLPGLGNADRPDGALHAVEGQLLVLQLLVLDTGVLTTGSGLQVGEDGSNLVLTNLLDVTENTGAEEDLGVAETVLLGLELGHVKASLGGALVVLSLGHSLGGEDVVAGLELGVGHLVGEAHAADGDTGQHAVALVLVHHQAGLNTAGLFVGVGHHATDEAGVGLVEGGHQVVQLALEVGGDGLAAALLLPAAIVLGGFQRLSGVVAETFNRQLVAAVLDELDDGVVEGILVLLQPAGQVVGDGGGVVDDGEMRIGIGAGVGLGEVGPLAEQVGHQLLSKCLVGGLGEERLLLKDGEQAHGLLEHVDTLLEIHAEVAVGPLDALLDVLLLLEDEHVVVEELLQLLVTEVDADLLEAVVVENR